MTSGLVETKNRRPKRGGEHGPLLPGRIVLRDLAARGLPESGEPANGDTLWAFIVAELGQTLQEYAPHLKKTLQEAGGLILLDGLDEVGCSGWSVWYHRFHGGIGRVELQEGIWPEGTFSQLSVDKLANMWVTNIEEAFNVGVVIF